MKILKDSTYNSMQEELERLRVQLANKDIEINNVKKTITSGPSSVSDISTTGLPFIRKTLKVVQPGFEFEVVPLIRKLSIINPDVSQAVDDLTKLANTGHKIVFNQDINANEIDKMRLWLKHASKEWHIGAAGIGGIINKMFRQLMIGGAISNEWIPNNNLDGISEIRFINPEVIRFVKKRKNSRYQPYQQLKHLTPIVKIDEKHLKKLNPNQFKYIALNGDTDVPYGTPPYLAALEPISVQKKMLDNLSFVVEAMGILGYIDARIDKPEQNNGESDIQYAARLTQFLSEFKDRAKQGLRDGINVGFMDDHEFEFKQTAKTAQGTKELFEQNELMVASGLKYDAAFMGRPGSTETLITILFTKMIAQLTNIQEIVKENLEYGYKLALLLGGFDFKSLQVKFNKSTLTDELKYQQGQEIKLRNLVVEYDQGLISQEQFADEMGYERPDQAEPRVTRDPGKLAEIQQETVDKKNREDDKDKSDRTSRDKKNPQGTVKRQKNGHEFSALDNTILIS